MPVSVVICDGNQHARFGLRMILDRDPSISVVADVANAEECLQRLDEGPVDVVLLEAGFSGLVRGIGRARGGFAPATVIHGITGRASEELVSLARANVCGMVHRDAPHDDLIHAVRAAAVGDGFASRALTGLLLQAIRSRSTQFGGDLPVSGRLTEREQDVVRLICRGLSNKAIAADLSVSEKTVKFHVSNVLAKAGLSTRAQLIASSVALPFRRTEEPVCT
ncbi:response regulator transcription factor [Streptomyces sp. NPDC002055]|uniref:response regulator transcription factor n=1 Tax=Streptomyces sp. NPDC002055 TaxID=3154534 RepID=UPI003319B207